MTTHPPVPYSSHRGLVVVAAVGLVAMAAFSVTTIPGVRSGPTFYPFYDGWLQGGAYGVLGAVALVRPWSTAEDRSLWWLVAGSVVLKAVGFVLFLSYVRLLADQPVPSVADGAWVASDVVMLGAVWVLLRSRIRARSIDLALDSLIVGLTVGGVAVELLFRTLMGISHRHDPDEMVATHLLYPALDVAALAVVSGALFRLGWRSWSTALLAAGITVDAAVDAIFAYQASAGTYHPGTYLSALSLLGTAATAFAGWAPDDSRPEPEGYHFSRVVITAGLSVMALAALVYGDVRDVPIGSILLVAGALLVAILRAMRTVVRNTDTAVTELERLADERQRLLDRLVQAQEDERARIAADVHDDSVQALAAVELRLGLLRRQLGDREPALARTTDTLAETVREAVARLRSLLFDLESPAVDSDLATALTVAAEDAFGDREMWRLTGEPRVDLPESQRVTAYRITREAMSNVVRHAHASHVDVRIARVGLGVEVVVEDDGVGFDPAEIAPRAGHLGIPAMADRATIAGGRLRVERREGGGTRIRLWLPSNLPARPEVAPVRGGPEGSA